MAEINHLQMNQISALTNLKEVDIPLKKERNPVKPINPC